MKFLKNILDALTPKPPPPNFIEYRVKCGKCGELVTIKVFPDRDLNPTYESTPAYVLRKEIMDSKCFKIMRLEVDFDSSRREIDRRVEGGEIVGE